eukprot:1468506-Rhodomonas_salina.1
MVTSHLHAHPRSPRHSDSTPTHAPTQSFCLSSDLGMEGLGHIETRALVVTPPSRKARERGVVSVALVDEGCSDAARAGAQVLVRAPAPAHEVRWVDTGTGTCTCADREEGGEGEREAKVCEAQSGVEERGVVSGEEEEEEEEGTSRRSRRPTRAAQ